MTKYAPIARDDFIIQSLTRKQKFESMAELSWDNRINEQTPYENFNTTQTWGDQILIM